MARQQGLPFQILMTLRVAALVLALSAAFLWFVLGRVQHQVEQSGRENFRLLAHAAFGELDAFMQSHLSYLDTIANLLPTLSNIYTPEVIHALALSFLEQSGPNAMSVASSDDELLYFVKKDPGSPTRAAYIIGRFGIQPDGSRKIWANHYGADHRIIVRKLIDFDLHPERDEPNQGARRTNGPYFSAPHSIPGETYFAVTLATRAGDRVLSLTTPLTLLDRLLERISVSTNGAALLLDDKQRVIAFRLSGERWHNLHLDKSRLKPVAEFGHFVLADAARATGRLAENETSLVSLNGEPFLLAWHPMSKIPGTQYRLLLLAPLSDMSQVAESARRDVWLLAIIGLAILLPFTWFGTGAMAGVLQNLVRESRRIGKLDFAPTKNPIISSVREVQELGLAHDVMRDALDAGTRSLERVSAQLARLVGIGVDLAKQKERQILLDAVLEAASEMAGAETVVLFLRGDDDVLRAVATRGLAMPQFVPVLDMKLPELQRESVAVQTALNGAICVVDDLENDPRAELLHMHRYKEKDPSFEAKTLVSLPLQTSDRVIGVMVAFNARDPELNQVSPFSAPQVTYLEALAAQATVALENQKLLTAQTNLLESLVRTLGDAVDAKSAYTGRHCARVPELAFMLAQEAHAADSGPLASFAFRSPDEWLEFRTGAWLHDCGKITSPEHVMDKATKLETIYNRLHEIRTRFEVLLRDARIETLQAQLSGRMDAATADQVYAERAKVLQDDYAFIAACNVGSEKMAAADIVRIQAISQQTWLRHFDDRLGASYEEQQRYKASTPPSLPAVTPLIADQPWHLIPRSTEETRALTDGFRMEVPDHLYNHGELYNLCIERGTLTREERFKINEHIIHTIRMLEAAKFPPQLSRVPEYAGTHHETLDGRGYPRGLTAAELSIPARIMAIADIFEALTASDRPYKPAKPLSEAIAILHKMKCKGQIDPDLFNLFLRSGVHLRYAERFLSAEQIDLNDITLYLD